MFDDLSRRLGAEGEEVAEGCIVVVGNEALWGFNSGTGQVVELEEIRPGDVTAATKLLADEGILTVGRGREGDWCGATLARATFSPHVAIEHLRDGTRPFTFVACTALLHIAEGSAEEGFILLDRFLANLPEPLPRMYAALLDDSHQLLGVRPADRLMEESLNPLPAVTAVLEVGAPWDTKSAVGPIRPASQARVLPASFVHLGTAKVARHLSRLDDEPVFASGISISRDDALAKAVGEAYERYAADIVTRELVFVARAVDDPGCLSPDDFVSFLPRQRAVFTDLTEFSAYEERVWARARYVSGAECAVLADLVFYPFGGATTVRHSPANSSGMAAGVSYEDALRRAWAELVERHCFMRTWLGKVPAPKIDAGGHAVITRYAEDLGALGWRLDLMQIGEREREAVVLAVASRDGGASLGCAAGDNPATAVEKAVEEAWSGVVFADDAEGRPEPFEVRTPSDHRRLYRWGDHLDQLAFLLDSNDRIRVEDLVGIHQVPDSAIVVQWPPWLTQPLHVVRVMHHELIPITFGCDREPLGRRDVQELVGPGSSLPAFPHPFP